MVALNKEKMMKLITEIEKTYNDIAPYAFKIAENQAFYNYQANKILSELGVQKGCDLEDEERARYYDLKSKANVFFNFYASALRISIYVKQLKRDMKDHGFTKISVNHLATTKCYPVNEDGSVSLDSFDTGANVSFKMTWKQFDQWIDDARKYEKSKGKSVHSISVQAVDDALYIYID